MALGGQGNSKVERLRSLAAMDWSQVLGFTVVGALVTTTFDLARSFPRDDRKSRPVIASKK
jgi:hypothetical protein